MADPHAVLGVHPGASKAEIKAAFRKKAMAHHPDMHATAPECVKKAHDTAFRVLNEAYQALMGDRYRYRQRPQPGRSRFAWGSYCGTSSSGAGASDYYAGGSSGAAGADNPFTSYYRSGSGSSYWGWRQYQRHRGFDFEGLFHSFSGISRTGAAVNTALGLLLVGSVLLSEPLAGALWARNNEGKLFSSIEKDYQCRKLQQQQRQQKAAGAGTATGVQEQAVQEPTVQQMAQQEHQAVGRADAAMKHAPAMQNSSSSDTAAHTPPPVSLSGSFAAAGGVATGA